MSEELSAACGRDGSADEVQLSADRRSQCPFAYSRHSSRRRVAPAAAILRHTRETISGRSLPLFSTSRYLQTYAERERLLKRNRSALWDVLESAERVGSLRFRNTQADSKRVCKILRRLSRYPDNRLQRPEGALAFSQVCREAGRHSGKRFHLAGSAVIEPPLHQAI